MAAIKARNKIKYRSVVVAGLAVTLTVGCGGSDTGSISDLTADGELSDEASGESATPSTEVEATVTSIAGSNDGSSADETTDQSTAESAGDPAATAASTTTATTAGAAGSAGGEQGGGNTIIRVIQRSDTADVDDRPLPAGDLLVVPSADREAFWSSVGFPADGPARLSKVYAEVDEAALPAGVQVVSTGDQGEALVEAVQPESLVCLANPTAEDGAGPPYRLVGCVGIGGNIGAVVELDFGVAGLGLSQL
jgi:hypothetical protein